MIDFPRITFEQFSLDIINEHLLKGPEVVPLRPKTFAVLCYLAERPGKLVKKMELLQALWPEFVCDTVLKDSIAEIRRALGDNAKAPRFIETAHRRGYRFIGKIEDRVADDESRTTNHEPRITNLVGRNAELAQLQQFLEKANRGERQVVFVTGEPGIGKTTLVDAFLATVDGESRAVDGESFVASPTASRYPRIPNGESRSTNDEPRVWSTRGQCLEYHGAGEALMPVLAALNRLCRLPGCERLVALLGRHAPMWLVQMPSLVSTAELEVLQRTTVGASRERMLREMAEAIEAMTMEAPLVLVLEDLHWSDYSTLDLISYLAQRREQARLMLIGTYRPADIIVTGHPLREVQQELQMHRQCAELPLKFLSEAAIADYLAARFPENRFPAGLARLIRHRTDGSPLYMVNVVDYLIAHGRIAQDEGVWELTAGLEEIEVGVPETIQQMIERQIERCAPEEQRVLEAASVIGMGFPAAAVAAALGNNVVEIEERCEKLARSQQFIKPRGTGQLPDGMPTARYYFIHTLYRRVLYRRLPAMRLAQMHTRIGQYIERAYGDRAGEVAGKLAMHFEQGRDYGRAIRYYQQAADNALRRFADHEGVVLARRGLEVLETLPEGRERDLQELVLQTSLSMGLMTTKGLGSLEVKQTCTRALELCRKHGERALLFPALWGLWRGCHIRAELTESRDWAEKLLRLAEDEQDPTMLAEACLALGATLVDLGEIAPALLHLERGTSSNSPQPQDGSPPLYGHNPMITCRGFVALAQWSLGYPDRALRTINEVIALARESRHPEGLADALMFAAWVHELRRESEKALELSDALMLHANQHDLVQWTAFGMSLRGYALAKSGQESAGIEQMRQALTTQRAIGSEVSRIHLLTLLAEVLGETGQAEHGLAVVDEALDKAHKAQGHFNAPHLYRVKGELLLNCGMRIADVPIADCGRADCGLRNADVTIADCGSRIADSSDGDDSCSCQSIPNSGPRPAPFNPQSAIRNPQSEAEACFHKAIEIARMQQAKSFELRAATSLARMWAAQGKKAQGRRMLRKIYSWFTEGFDTPDLKDAEALLK